MLDVYRTFYGFTGEPFRLGPDHRFSLHHSSYANAKAYLEYAIFQGEGFVMITGSPGTGKTTLISEILSVVDKEKIEVSTLTSTQLESRDLLRLVAHSFNLQVSDDSKATLLLEIKAYLLSKIHAGQRAILVVDEAQSLSEGAIEELRLLANFQHEYQLLLQIVLVGQEQLLEMIQLPAMEHLRQRLVGATSLQPLSLDVYIDYVEHRLSRVAWKGEPSIDAGALQLIYCYSGGVPRRINLIMNRLFIYGGMDEKQHFAVEDAQAVIKDLVEEYLLPSDPLIDSAGIEAKNPAKDADRPRYLPRDPVTNQEPEVPSAEPAAAKPVDKFASAESASASTQPSEKAKSKQPAVSAQSSAQSKSVSPRSTGGAKAAAKPATACMDVGSARRNGSQQPALKSKDTASVPPGQMPGKRTQASVRHKRTAAGPMPPERVKKKAGKGLFIALLLLAGAGSAYLLRDESDSLNQLFSMLGDSEGQYQSFATAVDPEPEPEQSKVGQPRPLQSAVRGNTGDKKALTGDAKSVPNQASIEPIPVSVGVTSTPKPVEQIVVKPVAVEPVAVEPVAVEPVAVEPIAVEQATEQLQVAAAKQPQANAAKQPEAAAALVEVPEKTVNALAVDSFDSQRTQLRRDAEQRFTKRQAGVLGKKVITSPAVSATRPSLALNQPFPGSNAVHSKKKQPVTIATIKQVLLQGRWSSAGKPASLLPSESTSCRDQSATLACTSVAQNVKTQYGLALYKVETTLSRFSPEGHFELAYRTLVRLVDGDVSRQPAGDKTDWQVSDYSMSCTLSGENRVLCLDGKGITREYRRTLP